MNRQEKIDLVEALRQRLEEAQATFLVDYKGLKVEEMNRLRKELKSIGSEFEVVKNRLLKLASNQTDTGLLREEMKGPTGIALGYEDIVGTAKALVEFGKEPAKLEIKSGQLSGRQLTFQDIKELAKLPDREVLLAQTLSAMQAVPASLVRVLNAILLQFLYVLKAIEQNKESSA